jgi:hypothetical protein
VLRLWESVLQATETNERVDENESRRKSGSDDEEGRSTLVQQRSP